MLKMTLLAVCLIASIAHGEEEAVPLSYTVSYEKQSPLGGFCFTAGSLVAREEQLMLTDGNFEAQYNVQDGEGTAIAKVRARRASEGLTLTVRIFNKAQKLVGFQEFSYGHGANFSGPKITLRGPINDGGCPSYVRIIIDPRD